MSIISTDDFKVKQCCSFFVYGWYEILPKNEFTLSSCDSLTNFLNKLPELKKTADYSFSFTFSKSIKDSKNLNSIIQFTLNKKGETQGSKYGALEITDDDL